jgi:nucleotide-binding universal stress UspA family protein
MGKILCATRGGKASYRSQDAAIGIAKEQGDTLLFIYVVDTHFLDKIAAPKVVDTEGEMIKMGKFLLLMAKERALEQNVIAETICRLGQFRDALIETALSEDVSLIVLGQPASEESVFRLNNLKDFVNGIESETGIKTMIV